MLSIVSFEPESKGGSHLERPVVGAGFDWAELHLQVNRVHWHNARLD